MKLSAALTGVALTPQKTQKKPTRAKLLVEPFPGAVAQGVALVNT
jgi:hypothetical protein